MTATTATTNGSVDVAEQMLAEARRLLDRLYLTTEVIAIAEVYLEAAEVARQHPTGAEDVLAAAAALRNAEDRPHSEDRDVRVAAARLWLRIAAAGDTASAEPVADAALPAPKPTPRRYYGTPTLRGFGS
jgi:hypothetical protein